MQPRLVRDRTEASLESNFSERRSFARTCPSTTKRRVSLTSELLAARVGARSVCRLARARSIWTGVRPGLVLRQACDCCCLRDLQGCSDTIGSAATVCFCGSRHACCAIGCARCVRSSTLVGAQARLSLSVTGQKGASPFDEKLKLPQGSHLVIRYTVSDLMGSPQSSRMRRGARTSENTHSHTHPRSHFCSGALTASDHVGRQRRRRIRFGFVHRRR